MISTILVIYCLAITALAIDQRWALNDLRQDLRELAQIRNDMEEKLDQAVQDRRVLGNALVDEVEENP